MRLILRCLLLPLGVVVSKLASLDELQGAVILHPGKITEDDIKGKGENLSECPQT